MSQPTARRPLRTLLLRGGAWSAGGKLAGGIAALLFNLLLARALSPTAFGEFILATSIVTLGATAGALGLDQGSVRLISSALADRRLQLLHRLVWRIFGLALIGAVVTAAALLTFREGLLAELFDSRTLALAAIPIALWAAGGVLHRVGAETFRGLQDIRMATLLGGITSSGVFLNFGLLAIAAGLFWARVTSVEPALWLVAALTSVLAVLTWILLGLRMRRDEALAPPPEATAATEPQASGGLVKIVGPLYLAAVLVAVRAQTDIWLLGALRPVGEVALYGAALRLASLLFVPMTIVAAAIAPFLAEAEARGGARQLERLARTGATVALAPTLLAALPCLLFPRQVMGLAFGEFYEAGSVLLLVLVIGSVLNVASGPNLLTLMMRGGERQAMVGMVLAVAFMFGAGWFGARWWGAVGVAVASLAARVIQILWMSWQVQRRVGVRTHAVLSPRMLRAGVESFRRRGRYAPTHGTHDETGLDA